MGSVHAFGQKLVIFQDFDFRENKPEKCVLRNSRRKKCLSRLKNKKFIKSKNWDFSKGVSPWFRSKIGNFSRF